MECEFSVMYKASELPADKDSGSFMGGKDCLRWKVDGAPFDDFDIAYWLPIFVEGAQETTEPMRLIAITGSKQMIQADWSVIGPLVPAIVSRLRRALNSKTPAATAACLDIVRCLLTTHPGACDAMMRCDGYRRMAPVPNLFIKSKEMVRTGIRVEDGGRAEGEAVRRHRRRPQPDGEAGRGAGSGAAQVVHTDVHAEQARGAAIVGAFRVVRRRRRVS